jgi:hypothetical protein
LRRGMGSKLGNQEGRLSFFHLVVIHIENNHCIDNSFM